MLSTSTTKIIIPSSINGIGINFFTRTILFLVMRFPFSLQSAGLVEQLVSPSPTGLICNFTSQKRINVDFLQLRNSF
jgi:hypothetical protein